MPRGWITRLDERPDGGADVQLTYMDGAVVWVAVPVWQRGRLSLDTLAAIAYRAVFDAATF